MCILLIIKVVLYIDTPYLNMQKYFKVDRPNLLQ